MSYTLRGQGSDGESFEDFKRGRREGTRPLRPSDLTHRDKLNYLISEESMSLDAVSQKLGISVSMVRACAEWHGLRRTPGHTPKHCPWQRYTELKEALRKERRGEWNDS